MASRPLSRVRWNLFASLLAMLLLSWGYFGYSFARDYRTIEEQCSTNLQTVAMGLEAHVRQLVQVVDILLLEINHHYEHSSVVELQAMASDWLLHASQLSALGVINVNNGSAQLLIADRPLPEGLSLSEVAETFPPLPHVSAQLYRQDGKNLLALSRSFSLSGRQMQVVGLLRTDELLDFHQASSLGTSGSVSVFHQNGLLLARWPLGEKLVGKSFAEERLFSELLSVSPVGVSRSPEKTDGIRRMVAHRKLNDLPLVVTVGTSVNWLFGDWQSRLIDFLLIQIAVTVAISLTLVFLLRTLSRVELTELGLAEREEHFRAVANSTVDAVISVDNNERIRFWSVGAEQTFGCPSTEALNLPVGCFLHFAGTDNPLTLKQLAEVNSPWSKPRTLDIQGQRKNGELFPTELSISHGSAAGQPLYTLIVRDVTERKQMEERIRRMASHDNLTGLPNRTLLMDRLQVAMAQVRRQGGRFALLFVDLDKFKPVNDNYGHDIGDRLLQQVASRMLDTVRASDTVARIGGDEFALLLTNIEDVSTLDPACENLLSRLRREFNVSSFRLEISCSIGVAIFDGQDQNASDLIKRADNAMYAAKRAGQNCFKYAPREENRSL